MMKFKLFWLVLGSMTCLSTVNGGIVNNHDVLDLSGQWRLALDPQKIGKTKQWHRIDLTDSIRLPGILAQNKKGNINKNRQQTMHLSAEYIYVGWAWYQKEINIPDQWKNKRITLCLERSKLTSVWVDDKLIGHNDSLGCMQVYKLPDDLKPGNHKITILVDNKSKPAVNGGHQITDHTQTNWNGIIGQLYLQATDKVWIDAILAYPDVKNKKVKVKVFVGNDTGADISGKVLISAQCLDLSAKHQSSRASYPFANDRKDIPLVFEYDMGPDAVLWDEFNPVQYRLKLQLVALGNSKQYRHSQEVQFGMREFGHQGRQFTINNKKTFLRGKHDALVFPLLGHSPMDKEQWVHVLKIAKQYGINHYRFHSCCPPEAAFAAADEVGIYMQPELYNFGWDPKNPQVIQYNLQEGLRVLKTYGNHPSFVMYAIGNELGNGREKRAELISKFRKFDNTRLYAQASNYEFWKPELAKGDDYWSTARTKQGAIGAVRGSFAHANLPLGHIQRLTPSTMYDYSKAIQGVPVPVIGHETGQFQVYPNFNEIAKYKGVQKPWNFEIFRQRLKQKGMLDQADSFFKASGALSVLGYREDIEAALRTPGFGGFQLLDLQDFPGQGTALVGILDAFMDSKGLISPTDWRKFCSETVPLLRFKKYTWTVDENFNAKLIIAHYGPEEITQAIPQWILKDSKGNTVSRGSFAQTRITQGTVAEMGDINIPLAKCHAPAKYTVTVFLKGTDYTNDYPLWVYPAKVSVKTPPDVKIRTTWNKDVAQLLNDGQSVLLLPKPESITNSIRGFFTSDYWCYPMFRNICQRINKKVAPGTLGILCDPAHPALALFPTENHSNWQWWHLITNSSNIILDKTPSGYRPIIQTIDNFERNHKLGLLFECKVGQGKLLICSIDLLNQQQHPEARQMLASLLAYAQSNKFNPQTTFAPELVSALLVEPKLPKAQASSSQTGNTPEKAVDGLPNTRWCAADKKTGHWWQVDLENNQEIRACEIVWESAQVLYQYRIEGSSDGKKWQLLSDQRDQKQYKQVHKIQFQPAAKVRFVRITITGLEGGWASIREFRINGKGNFNQFFHAE